MSLRLCNRLHYDCRRLHNAKVDKPMSSAPLCDKNISCQSGTAATENLSLQRLASIWNYWSMGFLQLDFSQISRMQDKIISLNTNTIRALTCPVTVEVPLKLSLKSLAGLGQGSPSPHSRVLLPYVSNAYSKVSAIPQSAIHCFPDNLSQSLGEWQVEEGGTCSSVSALSCLLISVIIEPAKKSRRRGVTLQVFCYTQQLANLASLWNKPCAWKSVHLYLMMSPVTHAGMLSY